MPWKELSPMDQKTQFVSEYLRDSLSFTELCQRYHISRKTGYKWIARYHTEGPAGLVNRSRRPHSSPEQTDDALRRAIRDARRRSGLDNRHEIKNQSSAQVFQQEQRKHEGDYAAISNQNQYT